MARLASPSEGPYLPHGIGSRFCDLRPLGYGSGGTVFSAVDSECDKSVAIKRISLADKKGCRSALREIRILRKLQHENIVKIYDVIFDGNSDNPEDEDISIPSELRMLCIVQELVDADLRVVMEHQRISNEHVRLFAYQLIRGLKYLHSANVLHRDLKPENVLINQEDLVLKIGDFGMARIVDPDYSHKGYLTQNVSTQWYRSPELVLQPTDYTKAIDLWSAGCILAEMVTGKPLFPGDHDLELMMLILDSIQLNDRDLNEILCTLPSKLLKNYNGYPRHPLKEMLSNLDCHALDLLLAMLTFDPSARITAEEALRSPYFKMYSCIRDEPIATHPFHIENEIDDLPPIVIKKIILEECQERTYTDVPFSVQTENVCDEREDNSSGSSDLLQSDSNGGLGSSSDEEVKEACIDNAFLNRMVSVGNNRSDGSEKNETEESEKSDDEEKEAKWEDFKEMMSKDPNNLEDRDDQEGDTFEKGSVESDNEGSEKSEADDQIREKGNNQDDEEKRGSKEDLLMEKSEDYDTGDNNKKEEEKTEEGAVSKTERKESLVFMDYEAVEKAFGDKLQKEKLNEQLCNRESEDGSVRKKETGENKELDLTDTKDILLEQQKSKGKTLDDCLELGMLRLSETSPTPKNTDVVLDKQLNVLDESKGNQEFNDKSEFVEQIRTDNTAVYNEKVNELEKVLCNTQTEKKQSRPKKPDLKEVLYVDIPKASASISPRSSPRGQGKETTRRNSLSPRERSVRPKKRDWYYSKH
nr:mitogen-activated protein kinase 6-like [Lytechinus pictus]